MWIFDSYLKGCVELWSRDRGLERISAAYPPSFYMHLKDPHAYWEMIEALESRYRVEECSFNSIFGTFEGHRIYASWKVALPLLSFETSLIVLFIPLLAT
jgi:DNA polymerase, archaea type